jgi:uncharacterized protein (TIGR03435 family)
MAMLQQLLAERFKLAIHRETKEEQVYELVIAKGGSKLKEADATRAGPKGVGTTGPGRLQGAATSMDVLTQVLAPVLSRSVIDKTGLTGKFDFTLEVHAGTRPVFIEPAGSARWCGSSATGPQRPVPVHGLTGATRAET